MNTKCPNCGKGLSYLPNMVQNGELKCKHCGYVFGVASKADPPPKPPEKPSKPPEKPAPSPKPSQQPPPVAEVEHEADYLI